MTAQQKKGNKEELTSKDYDRVINEYNRLGVPELALQQIRQLTEEGLSYLNQVPQGEATDRLRRLADQLVNRQS